MANWGKIFSRGNVEDRRGFGPAAIGGVGLTGILVLVGVNLLLGGDPAQILNQLQYLPLETQNTKQFEGEDSYEVFSSTVLGSNNDMWNKLFTERGRVYEEPRLVLFRNATESACGYASSEVGPHYCPLDKSIYLDETFFDELVNRFGAEGGDVAEAYVIAHEVGHHAQHELGILDESGNSNSDSIQIELQADCFAGLWANSIKDQGVYESNEIKEAMDAAAAVGDDRIQQRVQGQINPETWTHGSSAERQASFDKGYTGGTLSACEI